MNKENHKQDKVINTKHITKNERQYYTELPQHNNAMTGCLRTDPRQKLSDKYRKKSNILTTN